MSVQYYDIVVRTADGTKEWQELRSIPEASVRGLMLG